MINRLRPGRITSCDSFPGHPFPDIGRTVVQRDAVHFTGNEKLHGFAVQQVDLAKIENHFELFLPDETVKLTDVFELKSSGERKFHSVFSSLVSRNFSIASINCQGG